ncbi:MAG: hypothetical protein ACLS49_03880 [Christensenellales bacterium]
MNKIVKSIISIMMSLAMIVCIIPTEAMATEISEQDYGISVQRFTIGKKYTKKDNYNKITAYFVSKNQLCVECENIKGQNRYTELYVSTMSKNFKKRTFVLKKGSPHSEIYSIDALNTSKVTITIYPHTSTSPSSGYTDELTGIMSE